jgi:hypothetical protein
LERELPFSGVAFDCKENMLVVGVPFIGMGLDELKKISSTLNELI